MSYFACKTGQTVSHWFQQWALIAALCVQAAARAMFADMGAKAGDQFYDSSDDEGSAPSVSSTSTASKRYDIKIKGLDEVRTLPSQLRAR
jgi:hypothetical protein